MRTPPPTLRQVCRQYPTQQGQSAITMPNINVVALKTKLTREHRSNRRLRAVIEELREQLDRTRHDVDLHVQRFAQLQAEVDLLKRRRP
jgi:hypothetical protein